MSDPDDRREPNRSGDQLTLIGDLLPPTLRKLKAKQKAAAKTQRGPSAIERRLIEAAAVQLDSPAEQALLYQHSVFCQTYFPYRDPGDTVREWERVNGNVSLLVRAGDVLNPSGRGFMKLGLPYGPKCRLVLMALNQLAVVKQSAHIEVEDSLTAFVRRILKIDGKGRNIREIKSQLSRLAASDITIGRSAVVDGEGTAMRMDYVRPVQGFDLWFPKNESQRVLWPGSIDLHPTYFASLMQHAVPLDEMHIAALSHSGLALDVYTWLAHRLHRIPHGKPSRVSWAALHSQFGQGYDPTRMDKFRQVFRVALKEVLAVYRTARIEDSRPRKASLSLQDGQRVWREAPAPGLMLYNSPPPVLKLLK